MADDSAKLNIEVRVEGAPKAANDLKVVDDGIASGKKVTDDLAKSLDTANIKIAELERRLEAARRSSLSEKKATDELSKSLDTANAKIAELERRLEAAGRNGLGGRFNADSQAARGLLSTLGGLAKMLGVISIAGAGSSGLVKAWKDAGEYRQLGLSLETIGGIAGYSKHQLDNLTLGLRSLDMTGQQARQSLLTLAQAEIDLGKATDLVRISRDAAALSGKTEQQVYNGLISAIQSGRAQTLRSLGLNVDFAASYQNLARQLGVTQKELNETQKSQARLNAVIESGKSVAGGYESRLSETEKAIQSLQVALGNLSVDFGRLLNSSAKGGVFKFLLDETKQFATELDVAVIVVRGALAGLGLEEMQAASRNGVDALRALVEQAEVMADAVPNAEAELHKLTSELDALDKNGATFSTEAYRAEIDRLASLMENKAISALTFLRSLQELRTFLRAETPGKVLSDNEVGSTYAAQVRERVAELNQGLLKNSKQNRLDRLDKSFDPQIQYLREATQGLVKGTAEHKLAQDALNTMLEEKQRQRKSILGRGGSGGGSGNDISRVAYQASEAYERAVQATRQLRIENAQLTAELKGSGLEVALQKIASEYGSQIEAIRKEEAKLQEQMRQWGKKGKAGAEAGKDISKAQEELTAQRQLVEENRRLNEELARRNELEKELQTTVDYSRTIGDLRAMYDAEVQLLQVKMQSVNIEAERLMLLEQIRQAEARRDLDVGGMLQTGFMNKFQESRQGFVDFFEQDIPGILTSFEKGFANSIGRAIVYSEDLKSSLYEVGRSALASLISGLIQLGVQWLVTATLGNAIAAAQIGTMAPMATMMTDMWMMPAYLASVASWGGAVGAGTAALSFGMTTMKALTAVSGAGFQGGGYTGNLPVDQVAGVVHGQEYVFDAPSVSRIGRATLDAMRAGEKIYQVTPDGWSGSSAGVTANTQSTGGMTLKLSVQNMGTPQTYEMDQTSPDEIRLICRDEIRKTVPGLVNGQVNDPNSVISSGFDNAYQITRRR